MLYAFHMDILKSHSFTLPTLRVWKKKTEFGISNEYTVTHQYWGTHAYRRINQLTQWFTRKMDEGACEACEAVVFILTDLHRWLCTKRYLKDIWFLNSCYCFESVCRKPRMSVPKWMQFKWNNIKQLLVFCHLLFFHFLLVFIKLFHINIFALII